MERLFDWLAQNAALLFAAGSGATIQILTTRPGWKHGPADWVVCFLTAVSFGPTMARGIPAFRHLAPWIPSFDIEQETAAVVTATGICGVIIVKIIMNGVSRLGGLIKSGFPEEESP
jgi:hypothetical protein